jgi:biotin carboxylase
MKTQIIILGAGVMQGPVIRIAREMGLYTVVVDADGKAVNVPMADRFEQIDLKDKEGIEALGRSLLSRGKLGGIMTAGTDFSSSVAWAAERLGLPGIPYEAALNASDKGRMRSCFEKAGVPSPAYRVVSGPGEIPPGLSLPAVVKPVDNMGGRGCRRVDSPAEMKEALAGALGFSRTRRAIVENFIEGPEFSVDAVVYDDDITICGLADRHIFFPPYFIEMGHTMPTGFPPEDQESMLETFKAAVRALGIAGKGRRGAAKGDIKLSPAGPMIGEVAARLSGGYMSGWTYPYSSGVEPIRGAIEAALGRRPENLAPRRFWTDRKSVV